MTPILVLWIGIALVALAVIVLARLLTHHTFLSLPSWSKSAPRATPGNDTSANDRTQLRRAAR